MVELRVFLQRRPWIYFGSRFLSIHPYNYLSIYPSINLTSWLHSEFLTGKAMALFRQQVSIYPSIKLSIYISNYLSNYMIAYRVFDREAHGFNLAAGIYLSIYLSIYPSIYLSIYPSIYPST